MDWKKIALIGAGIGGLALLAKAMKPTPPTPPGEPAPIKNPSFEDGLTGWEQVRYAPHPTKVGNSEYHLINTTSNFATDGVKALYLKAHKEETRNVVCKVWQEIDLSSMVNAGYKELLIDLNATLNFDAVEAPWGGYYAYVSAQLGGKRWWKHTRGTYKETAVFDLTEIEFPTKLEFAVAVWDHEPKGSFCKLWADNIRVR